MPSFPDADTVLNGFTEPVILIDNDYRILAVNQAYKTLYETEPALGESRCYEVSHGFEHPCDQAGESCCLKLCRQTGTPQRDLHVHLSPQGRELVDVEIRPLVNADGVIEFYLETLKMVRTPADPTSPVGLVGQAPPFLEMLHLISRVANSKTTVLLSGESGTGKELAAQTIHHLSDRRNRPFVTLECSGLSENLFESELFGYERGAFTGAVVRKQGLVEVAHEGTLFLDEIGDIPMPMQVKLLRLLETRTYRKVGSVEHEFSDFRLVCATHRDLPAMVARNEFRLDLYYRINAFPIRLPALRERTEDLPLLVQALLRRLAPKRQVDIAPEEMALLHTHPFPGNIRELYNLLERALLLMDGTQLTPEHLPDVLNRRCQTATETDDSPPTLGEPEEADGILPLATVERRYLRYALSQAGQDKDSLARQLGISVRTLYRKLQTLEETETQETAD